MYPYLSVGRLFRDSICPVVPNNPATYPYLSVGRLFRDFLKSTRTLSIKNGIPTYRWGGYFETFIYQLWVYSPSIPTYRWGGYFETLLFHKPSGSDLYPYLSVGRLFRDGTFSPFLFFLLIVSLPIGGEVISRHPTSVETSIIILYPYLSVNANELSSNPVGSISSNKKSEPVKQSVRWNRTYRFQTLIR